MPGLDRSGDKRSAESDGAAGILKLALQGKEIGVAVKDAGHRRDYRAAYICAEGPFDPAHGGAINQAELLNAIGFGAFEDLLQLIGLGVADRDHELAAALHGDAVRIEIGIQHPAAVDAVAGLEASGSIIKPGMDHFGIARRGAHGDLVFGFEHDDLPPRPG